MTKNRKKKPSLTTLSRSLIAIFSTTLLAACFTVILSPGMSPDKVAIGACLLFIALLGIGRGALWHNPGRWFWILIGLSLFSAPFIVIAQGFGSVDMMAFLFHLEFGVEGAGLEELHNEILTAILALTWIVFATYALSKALDWLALPYVTVGALLVLSHPMLLYALTAARAANIESDLAKRLVSAPTWNKQSPDADLVVLYLEGLEAAYFDPFYLSDGLAPFTAIRDDGLRFTGVRQIEATGWSMAGVVATQCGVPLIPNGFRARNNFHGVKDFLGKHRCLGDILKQAGYQLEFLQGGDLDFAGYGTFLRQHGFDKVIGIEHFQANYPKELIEKARIDWIVDDQLLFTEALKRHRALLQNSAPYGLFIETITTHGDITYASRECTPDGQARQVSNVPLVLECVGRQLTKLVKSLRDQAGSRPMRLVILSDHLSHSKRIRGDLPVAERANTVALIDWQSKESKVVNKEGSMIDVYPTLLDWLELASDTGRTRAGLGVSLLSSNPTLVEEKGLEALNKELYINPALSRKIWRDGP